MVELFAERSFQTLSGTDASRFLLSPAEKLPTRDELNKPLTGIAPGTLYESVFWPEPLMRDYPFTRFEHHDLATCGRNCEPPSPHTDQQTRLVTVAPLPRGARERQWDRTWRLGSVRVGAPTENYFQEPPSHWTSHSHGIQRYRCSTQHGWLDRIP